MSKIRLAEPIFRSVQGEGNRTGVLSIWLRFFGCSLRCGGFFQPDPTDESTWLSPLTMDPKSYKSLADLPVVKYGCDSLYAIDPRFKHLAIDYENAESLYLEIDKLLYNGKWQHPLTKNEIDLCFTGGEPMMQQQAMIEIMKQAKVDKWKPNTGNAISGIDYPRVVQIETNGTKKINEDFKQFYVDNAFTLNWNVSPKLHHVSGEKDAVKYDIIQEYFSMSPYGCLKFVVNDRDECWTELKQHTKELQSTGVPIFVMPCGATQEQQEEPGYLTKIANRAVAEGYHVSGRLHTHIWGNSIGT